MSEQLTIFGESVTLRKRRPVEKERRRWENAFQKWSNEQFQDGRHGYGACGYGSMCDYCEDNSYGRPCVRALNEMCREKGIKIDYTNNDYEQLWDNGCQTEGAKHK